MLILDEPSSSLSAHDVGVLMALARRLRDAGAAVLYISHRLNEVLDLCDYVTVLKDGIRTADRPLAGIDPDGLVHLMVGRGSYAGTIAGAVLLVTMTVLITVVNASAGWRSILFGCLILLLPLSGREVVR